MAGSIIPNGSNVTLRFEWTTTATIAQATAGAAAEELYNRGLGDHNKPFSAYTNQEKVNLLDGYFLQIVNNLARDFKANQAAEAARAASLAESATNLHL
jgi:hypothetical protein